MSVTQKYRELPVGGVENEVGGAVPVQIGCHQGMIPSVAFTTVDLATGIEERTRREGAVAVAEIDLHRAVCAKRRAIQHRDIELAVAIEVTGRDADDALLAAEGADVGKDRGAERALAVT